MLSSCSALKRIQISQDKLPWKSSGDVLVQDDFSDERTGWEIVNNVYELKGYSEEGYLISINNRSGRSISTAGLQFSDIQIQVEAHKLTGGNDAYLGIVCRYQDSQNYYRFFVTPDGYVGIIKMVNGASKTLPDGQIRYHQAVKQNDGSNLIEVSCIGEVLSLSVNGRSVLEAEDGDLKNGDAGVFAETGQDGPGSFIFNDFRITKP